MSGAPRQIGLRPWHLPLIGAGVLVAILLFSSRASHTRHGKRIICTFLPTYVFTLNVAKDVPAVAVELLINAKVGCPHDYSLRPEDLRRVAQADVIVTNGLDLDPFLGQLKSAAPRARLITISDDCDVLYENGEHTDSQPGSSPSRDGGSKREPNPHVWVSPREAIKQVRTLATKLAELDPDHARKYETNASAYAARLHTLQMEFEHAASLLTRRQIVTFHDAFAYLARDLKLKVVATLTQDPDQAPSAHQIAETIDTIRRTHAAAIFYEPAYSDQVARTISRETGVPLYPLNPFNSIEGEPGPLSYEEVMAQNLTTLQNALGGST